jgi:hypothetical protein
MSLSDIVNVSITANTKTPTRQGFGTPLIAGYHTAYADRVREYSSYAALTADHAATTPIARCAAKIFGQNPAPKKVKVGRRALAMTQRWRLTPTSTTVGLVYTMTFKTAANVESVVTYTVAMSDTVALIIDGLITAIGAASPAVAMTPTDNTTNFDLVAAAGVLFDVTVNAELSIKDTTTDPGIATDLAAILVADPDWYGLCLDSNSELEGLAAASWTETNKKLLVVNSYDTEITAATAGNFFLDLESAAYARTVPIWSGSILSYAGAAWLGKMLPYTPGDATWKFKTLAGVTVDVLTDTQQTNIKNARGNWYVEVGGINMTQEGWTSSGEFADVTQLIDYLTARIRENVFALFPNSAKLPYTDGSVSMIKGVISATIKEREPKGIVPNTTTVTAPLVADVSAVDRAARLLPDVEFQATLAGAIHATEIAGVLSV